MKKLRLIPPLALLLCCLCVSAMAAGISGQQSITAVQDANGHVTDLTDDDASTAWIRQSGSGADLTLSFYNARVGEIWIRNGYAYTQNWYSHYDRPSLIKVTVYYYANQVTETYDTFRYQLTDAYRPNALSQDWNSGYQRLLLPKQYHNVTRIELTIEDTIAGTGRTGVAISDIIVASGNHATATPKSYATATPKPYIVYITPTPGPQTGSGSDVDFIVPGGGKDDDAELIVPGGDTPGVSSPTKTPLVTIITPKPTEPLVEFITPKPTKTPEPLNYPSLEGVIAYSNQRIPTRSGPGTMYDEPGSFGSAGMQVKVISKVWDSRNRLYWFYFEFQYEGKWRRHYTTESRLDLNPDLITNEQPPVNDPLDTCYSIGTHSIHYGPGSKYAIVENAKMVPDKKLDVFAIENGWALVDYYDYARDTKRRGWVPLEVVYPES